MYGNKMASLPTELGQLSGLQTLMLQENNLSTLPDTLGSCPLRVLDLRHNKFLDVSSRSPFRITHPTYCSTHYPPLHSPQRQQQPILASYIS